jgi:hypothetical protein
MVDNIMVFVLTLQSKLTQTKLNSKMPTTIKKKSFYKC